MLIKRKYQADFGEFKRQKTVELKEGEALLFAVVGYERSYVIIRGNKMEDWGDIWGCAHWAKTHEEAQDIFARLKSTKIGDFFDAKILNTPDNRHLIDTNLYQDIAISQVTELGVAKNVKAGDKEKLVYDENDPYEQAVNNFVKPYAKSTQTLYRGILRNFRPMAEQAFATSNGEVEDWEAPELGASEDEEAKPSEEIMPDEAEILGTVPIA